MVDLKHGAAIVGIHEHVTRYAPDKSELQIQGESVIKALEDAGLTADQVNEVILVGGQTRMPAIQDKVKQIFRQEPNRSINPDEAVAVGAAIQGGVLTGDVQDLLLLDVTPLSLGLETLGGVATTIIPRNTTIPTSKSQTFSTAADGQTSVEIHVFQGERQMAGDNKSLGRFMLDGIPPAPRGVPQIEVTFDTDANGILNVIARDQATNREQKIVIQGGSGLTDDEIAQMTKDAESHAAEDTKRREDAEVRNTADSAAYAAERLLAEHGDRVPEDVRSRVEGKVQELRQALEQNAPAERIRTLTTELSAIVQEIGQSMYAQQGADAGGATGTSDGGAPDDPETVEGEYREVN